MSRDKTKKSNIHIGIFSGKSAEYNLAILETLFLKKATAWKIARILQNKINPSDKNEVKYYRAQKIYSVIQRKSGRLADLKSKGYLKETNGNWGLTRKGLVALSVRKPELVESGLQSVKGVYADIFSRYVNAIPDEKIVAPFGIQIDLSKLKPYFRGIDPTSKVKMLIEESKILLSQGIELDSISEKDLFDIAMVRSARKEAEK